MPRPPQARSGADRPSRAGLYQEITARILAELEAGRLPWVQPWGTSAVQAPLAMPSNAGTGRRYSSVNVLILWGAVVQHGFSGQSWLLPARSSWSRSRRTSRGRAGRYGDYIARALATGGGYLSLGRGGATLYFEHARLSGCLEEQIKAEVIDSREIPFEAAYDLAVHGPMVAVGEPPSPPPYHALSFAPLAVVAEAYRAVGAAVFNIPRIGVAGTRE